MYKLPKVLILDYKKWICGGGVSEIDYIKPAKRIGVGKGYAALLNQEGYMCCLGQFCSQAGLSEQFLLEATTPQDTSEEISVLTDKEVFLVNTSFSNKAIDINDDCNTTIVEKVIALTKLCSKHGRKLVLKNFPKSIIEALKESNTKFNVWGKNV